MKKILLFAAACVALAACNKDNIDTATAGRQITISASVQVPGVGNAPMTKVSPDSSSLSTSTISFHWEAGDKVLLANSDFSEMQVFTIIDSSINGATANFTGTALTDMSSYLAAYYGNNNPKDKFIEILGGIDSLTYEANNFHPYVGGSGNAAGFTLNSFTPEIKIPLKGNATIGKLDYCTLDESTFVVATTMSFGTGLELTDKETPVYMPIYLAGGDGFRINIYDTDNQLLLEKTVTSSVLTDNQDKLISFPALTVNAAQ